VLHGVPAERAASHFTVHTEGIAINTNLPLVVWILYWIQLERVEPQARGGAHGEDSYEETAQSHAQ